MSAEQLSFLDLIAPPPALMRFPVDPHGEVVQGAPDETLTLPHPRMAWPLARIEMHQHTDGRWMWSASAVGRSYKVGPKWGRFAQDRETALRGAAREVLDLAERAGRPDPYCLTAAQLQQVKDWAKKMGC